MIATVMRKGLEDKCQVTGQGWFAPPKMAITWALLLACDKYGDMSLQD